MFFWGLLMNEITAARHKILGVTAEQRQHLTVTIECPVFCFTLFLEVKKNRVHILPLGLLDQK